MGLFNAHISPQGADPDPGPANQARYYAGPEHTPFILRPGEGQTEQEIHATWASDPRRPLDLEDPPNDPRLAVARHGELMKLHGSTRDGQRVGGGRRGEVRGMSRQSRQRLMELFASIDRRLPVNLWLFCTLTYPGVYDGNPLRWKRDLDCFFKRLARVDPLLAAIWRLEFQTRGAPHYHVLICGRAYLDYRWVRDAWFEIVGSDDDNHLRAGTQVRTVSDWQHATRYVGKYCAKEDKDWKPQRTGRVWGIHNRKALPVEVLELPLLWFEFHQLRRLMRRHQHGSKPWPLARGPPAPRQAYRLRSRSRAGGAKLFVAESVCYRILRGVPTLLAIGQDPPEIGTNRLTFGKWIRDPAQGGRPGSGPLSASQGK